MRRCRCFGFQSASVGLSRSFFRSACKSTSVAQQGERSTHKGEATDANNTKEIEIPYSFIVKHNDHYQLYLFLKADICKRNFLKNKTKWQTHLLQ
jgi:hypothetical protein